jgi:hypothetical protein
MDPVTGSLIATFSSPNPRDTGYFGYVVAAIPDFTGDSSSEFIVGAHFETTGTNPLNSGAAYVYNGRTGALVYALTSPTPVTDGLFGWIVAGVPDLDGDGNGDFMIGARQEINPIAGVNSGRVHVYSGVDGTHLYSVDSPNPTPEGNFAWHLTGLPDFTGDGRGDLAVGAYQEPGHLQVRRSGTVYLFNGATGSLHAQIKGGTVTRNGGFGNHLAGPYKFQAGFPVPLIVGEYQAGADITGRVHRFLLSPATNAVQFWSIYE